MNFKSKLISIITAISILTCGTVAYATLVPENIKSNIHAKLTSLFGVEIPDDEEEPNIQSKTVDSILESTKENKEIYSRLLDPIMYISGDNTEGVLIESNIPQGI